MKKIKVLQALVFVLFMLCIGQNAAVGFYNGFKDGWNDVYYAGENNNIPAGHYIHTTIKNNVIDAQVNNEINNTHKYSIRNISVDAEIFANKEADSYPDWTTLIRVALSLTGLGFLIRIAATINKIIKIIAEGTMFNDYCIAQLHKTGVLLVIYTFVMYAYGWIDFYQQTYIVKLPLKLINTNQFDYETLICAILVFIIAEAFKQGVLLKQEQDLTI